MQYKDHWPDTTTLNLPKAVSQDIHLHLLEPFDSENDAKDFWGEAPSSIIILEPSDTLDTLHRSEAWSTIEFALTYPEYDVPLSHGYQMLLAITNDSGSGIHLIIPPELSNITSEVQSS